jgi:hypothetical protein
MSASAIAGCFSFALILAKRRRWCSTRLIGPSPASRALARAASTTTSGRLLRIRLEKTAVETIFVGKQRQCNRRFLQMWSHHEVEPAACTPASGWEKGQVENQVGLVRERFFTPRLRFKTYDELNAWLVDKCVAYVKAHPHPERPARRVWEVFEEERPNFVPIAATSTDSMRCRLQCRRRALCASTTTNSVSADAIGRPVEVQAYAERFVIRQDGRVVREHARSYGRGEMAYDPRGIMCRFWLANQARCEPPPADAISITKDALAPRRAAPFDR